MLGISMRPFVVLMGYAIAGEAIARTGHLPIPGSVIGLLLLLAVITLRNRVSSELQSGARALLARLPLLFVPAGVGIVAHLRLIRAEWLPIGAAIVGSSLLAIVATAATARFVERGEKPSVPSEPLPALQK
jgi:holin-like protein